MKVFALPFALGSVAGLRTFTAPAAISWAVRFRWLALSQTRLAFFESAPTAPVLTALAVLELGLDKLPQTPSRKIPASFAVRIVSASIAGAALCLANKQPPAAGIVAGSLGAVAGTLGGFEARTRLVQDLRVPDVVIALLEDALAVSSGLAIVSRFSSSTASPMRRPG